MRTAKNEDLTETGGRGGQWQVVYDGLQKGIISGRYRSGVRLIEDDIIEATGATRHAVRKAFDELVRLGLAVRYPHRGVQVRSFTASEIWQIYEVRECLELKAISYYTEPAAKELVRKLKAIVSDHERAIANNDLAEMYLQNNLLHEAIYQRCENEFLLDAIKHHSLLSHLIHTNSVQSKDLRSKGAKDHLTMIQAIEKGDQKTLARTLRNHIRTFRDYYLQHLTS
ncbi:GntR family transcriptional regulator [Mesorhizobium sp. M2D.F.Ca.ET.185.01.1.1]|uniref:GntR family transcriptional regulator n=1 Tax=unclassified Mesorhizobium TaxID=325217 RepID=UPI000FCC471F|nr:MULTISPECIES: GntR family transcriptional regulator [unclassified Mesorhizobium]TGP50857.1 GntR family transcriptional regulator [bacterium M00.F.Ca.ET.230.01.1.1]TGP77315.1 GntR family transcriptional regulator [bacterium M00.F.Ca.ET.227.01.1.1]TGP93109.1 GntR family transcriptional regulator [bacterium M00.F.Ca.ET.222.01.1.1]TGP96655.1 GntR family transcriptional regulator [bacterium M00.F.Ca.ET.221.01.1.1]TGT95929.1 GntR family transcriptional regulator [bacterium M00.F.Ca.ET.163.01.1.1]